MAQVIAIGASQGGVIALRSVVSKLPRSLPAAIMVVVHTGEESMLPSLLNDVGELPARHAFHGQVVERGHIYVAPPGRHMLLVDTHVHLSRGPRENWARPAIDPLFRTVAEAYGPDAAGVVLTGALNDGTAGLYEIKRRGGTAIVQDPSTAEVPGMPRSALENVPVDYCVSIADIPPLLVRLAKQEERRAAEVKPAEPATIATVRHEGMPIAQTCPECGGAMVEEVLGRLTRFRCHIGHIMTAEVLAAAQLERLDHDLSRLLRMLNERADLCRKMARKHRIQGNAEAARLWELAGEEAADRQGGAHDINGLSWSRPEAAE
jgi:two-component system, chemotaxis family, protein-glutamate methylesterase/glutaminase